MSYQRDASRGQSSGSSIDRGAGRAVGRTTLVEQTYGTIYRKAEGAAAAAEPGAAFAKATSGAAASVPYRAEMESAFGQSFGDVRAHLGGAEAREGLSALGARAAAHGNEIAFSDGSPGRDLVAHELAHVAQQRGGGGIQAKPTDVSAPGDAAEQRADAAADAVMRGEPVPDVGTAPSTHLHRAPVDTNGGTWDTTSYSAINTGAGVGKIVGCTVGIKFTPKDPVVADTIGLTQTVKTLHSTSAGGPVGTDSTVSARNASLNLTAREGDQGRAIDQGDPGGGDTIPNTNPFYAVENSAGHVSGTLTDVPATAGFGTHGHRKALPGGGFDVKNATLGDTPRRRIAFAGEEFNGKFETTALIADGPQKDTYLGSVEWGYKVDAAGTASVDPAALRVVRAGAPSSQFMAAATKWNNATFTDPSTGTVHNTVDLPVTSIDDSGAVAATGMTTAAILARIAVVQGQLAGLAAGPDKTNKEFEKTCLENELRTRNAVVEVHVVTTEDDLGADEVYVRLTGPGGGRSTSPVHDLNNGQRHDFVVPLNSVLPLTGAIQIDVFDEDWPDGDDHLVHFDWAPPFAAARNTATMDGAKYNVTVRFER